MHDNDATTCIYRQYFLCPLDAIAFVSIIYPTYLFIRAFNQKKVKASPKLFWCAVVFFVNAFTYHLSAAIYYFYGCIDGGNEQFTEVIYVIPSFAYK